MGYLEALSFKVGEDPSVGREIKAEEIAVQGLAGLAVPSVHLAATVFAIPQKGVACVGKGGTDLVGAAGEKLCFHQTQSLSAG